MAVVAPAATITEAGTGSAALLEDSATVAPLDCDTVTVQVVFPPTEIEVGPHDKPVTVTCGITVTGAVIELPFSDAVTVTD